MTKRKNALTTEIRACRYEILWCNIKLFAWYVYGVFHLIMIPAVFAVFLGRYAPFLCPIILFICYKELKLISDNTHPVNTKIENIKQQRNKMYLKIDTLKINSEYSTVGRQLSIFESAEAENGNSNEILTHIISTKHGYYKDVTERTEENTDLIDKWIDKTTNCLYMVVMYRDGEPESITVTRELFDTVYKQFDL